LWTTADELKIAHTNKWQQHEPDVWSVETAPRFGIGQRAHLIRTPEGNLLWDCVSLLDEATAAQVREFGGIRAIAISHPHYYSALAAWSSQFGDVPVYIHTDDREWVVYAGPNMQYWTGEELSLFGGIRLIRSGGHFPGYQVAHCNGSLFAGDQPQVCLDGKWVTFMYSYPNWIPFDAPAVNRICRSLEPLQYDRIYGAFGRNLLHDAKAVVERSRDRYLAAIGAR
jgi:glyoxylase-like metal-dependent hydrolase (beta-lactamase superfamily II)